MKLIINGRFLTQQPSGVQNYAIGILTNLQKAKLDIEVVIPRDNRIKSGAYTKAIGWGKGFIWEQLFLPLYVKKQKGSILINFCNSAPLFIKNQIVTIHDLAFKRDKGNWFNPLFRMWYNFLIPKICKRSMLIFTVSQFSKNEILNNYRVSEKKIRIIPNGLPEITFNAVPSINGKYVLITGANNPRKNAGWVVNNINVIKQKGYKLVVLSEGSVIFNNVELKESEDVILFKDVSFQVYHSLLKNAEALLFPSLYEGFGIPILESLCIGVPVIASNLEVFKESFGNLPIYFELNNTESFAKAINEIREKHISEEMIVDLKNKFNFEKSVKILIRELEQLK